MRDDIRSEIRGNARQRLVTPFARFFLSEAAGGVLLMACAAIALVWANSPWASTYDELWHIPLVIGTRTNGLGLSLHEWIGDGLMAVFFFLVGLEIKRELLDGELASVRKAALPVTAALGGMIVPALLYAALNATSPGHAGWGIPMATDIAFALGVLALLGPRVPPALRVFLAALAIADDLGAVLVIALFYTATLAWTSLAIGFGAVCIAALGNAFGVRWWAFYVAAGIVAWLALLHSGVHATVAGVLIAFTVPARPIVGRPSPLARMERALTPFVAFVIMPLFALANAGVALATSDAIGAARVTIGALMGLIVGKPLGITLFAWLSVRLGVAAMPEGSSWRALRGVSLLGGVGFTMSLFIAGLAFGETPLLGAAKLGILAASLVAGVSGWLALRRLPPTASA
ncbi:MAG TPA: Na+/H+ antiporter NhaA [Candidatus Elarobacter sp.]|nr:Na+/H+ antiporter NhaA [Candidatus Elarobacter sp.]